RERESLQNFKKAYEKSTSLVLINSALARKDYKNALDYCNTALKYDSVNPYFEKKKQEIINLMNSK
ncbi:hypothetical protein KGV55_03580, partial [Candidatus Gracilibacteria bacterium]|nr:hypothetical protein [Candidatus Gracilibacteria bacterium]